LWRHPIALAHNPWHGVFLSPRAEASKWLNLSTAAAPRQAREARARIRDAVTTKMTRGEIAQARLRALESGCRRANASVRGAISNFLEKHQRISSDSMKERNIDFVM
jgi:phosphoenolpyruvate-protein kinase (PTS system EI component)